MAARRRHKGKSYFPLKRSATSCWHCQRPLRTPTERSLRLCGRCEIHLGTRHRLPSQDYLTPEDADAMGLDGDA